MRKDMAKSSCPEPAISKMPPSRKDYTLDGKHESSRVLQRAMTILDINHH